MNNQPQLNIDLTQSTECLSSTGGQIFQIGYVVRRISKFLTATDEDILVPVQVFFDAETGEIATELLPPDLRPFYQKHITDTEQSNG